MTDTVHVLWTSGWDSTFRVLEAALVHHRPVQPHYVVDPRRMSTQQELNTMARIMAGVKEKFPDSEIRAPRFGHRYELLENPDIKGAFQRNRKQISGTQYGWLAQYAAQYRLSGLELGIHSTSLPTAYVRAHCESFENAGPNYRVRSDAPKDVRLVFENFHFGIFDRTKVEMEQVARQAHFFDLLDLSWFCHSPWFDGSTCGICLPCRSALNKGMARRVSQSGVQRSHNPARYQAIQETLSWPNRRYRAWFPKKISFFFRNEELTYAQAQ